MAKTISFGGMTNADLESQQLELERRQAMIDAIRKSAVDPIQQQQVSGHVVPISGWEGLAKLGQAYLARRGEKKVSAEKQALASELSTRAANALRSLAPEGTFDPTYTGPMSRTPAGSPAVSSPNKEAWTKALAAYQLDPEMGRGMVQNLTDLTTEQKNMAAQGIDPELMGALRIAEARKNGMLEMSPNSTAVNMMDNTRMVAPDFASGTYGGFSQSGQPVMGGIPGNQVIPQMAGATRAAEQEAAARFNMMPVNAQGGPVLMSQAQAAQQAGSVGIPLQSDVEKARLLAAQTPEAQQPIKDATSVLSILDMAEPLLSVATGSGAGALRDSLGNFVGQSSEAAQAAAQLASLGGLLVSKMPKMSGPQSDKDALLYREMAGQIGDPTIPGPTKAAAVRTLRELNQKYLAENQGSIAGQVIQDNKAALTPEEQAELNALREKFRGR